MPHVDNPTKQLENPLVLSIAPKLPPSEKGAAILLAPKVPPRGKRAAILLAPKFQAENHANL